MPIVSNTSPIGNFAVIGQLSLMQQIYPKIIIPPTVYAELMRLTTIQTDITALLTTGWLEIQPIADLILLQTLNAQLDPGEAEAIALAIETKADRLLIDERLGRSIATKYGLKIRGLLGILVNAKTSGLIPALKPILDTLINQAGFRVSQMLYERTLQDAGESVQ